MIGLLGLVGVAILSGSLGYIVGRMVGYERGSNDADERRARRARNQR